MNDALRKLGPPLLLIGICALLASSGVGKQVEVERKTVSAQALSNIPGHSLTAVTIELGPGVTVPAHRHDAFVFVYVLEGIVRSQLDDADVVDYAAGESWVEPLGVTHSLTQNPSDTENAKVLAIFVAKSGAELTTSGEIPSATH